MLRTRNPDARPRGNFGHGVRPEKTHQAARTKIAAVIAPCHAERLREFPWPAAQPRIREFWILNFEF